MFRKFTRSTIQKKTFLLQRVYVPEKMSTIASVGLIVDLNILSDYRDMSILKEAFIRGDCLNQALVEVDTIVVPLRRKNAEIIYTDKVFTNDQLTWRGAFKTGSDAQAFKDKKYDVLVNYFAKASCELAFLSAATPAKFRIGLRSEQDVRNDLTIVVDPDAVESFTGVLQTILSKIN